MASGRRRAPPCRSPHGSRRRARTGDSVMRLERRSPAKTRRGWTLVLVSADASRAPRTLRLKRGVIGALATLGVVALLALIAVGVDLAASAGQSADAER